MTTDAPTATATNPTATDTESTDAEKRADAEPMAPSSGNGEDLPAVYRFKNAIRDALGNGSDEEAWPPGTSIQDAAVAAIKERNRLRAALERIEAWQLPPAKGRDGKPSTYECEYGSNGAKQYIRQIAYEALERK